MTKLKGVATVWLPVGDIQRAVDFYADVLAGDPDSTWWADHPIGTKRSGLSR